MRTLRLGSTLLATGLAATLAGTMSMPGAFAARPEAVRAPRPGQWTEATSKLTNIADVGLARGKDGVLHVLWTSGNTGSYRISDTPVSARGVVGKPVTIEAHIDAAN